MLSKQLKSKQVSELSDRFEKAQGSFVIHFQGLNVEDMTHLRGKLRSKKAEIKVIRNTLAKRALENFEIKKELQEVLSGSTAFVFAFEDVSGAAKVLYEFSEDTALKIKKGVIDSKVLSEKEVEMLAKLPSLDELRSKLLILFSTPPSQLLRVFCEPMGGFVRLLNEKKSIDK